MAIQPEEVVQLLDLDLAEQGLDTSHCPPDFSIRQAAAFSLRRSIIQKWSYQNSSEADSKAKAKFLASNERCRDWKVPGSMQIDSYSEMLYNGFKTAVYDFWNRKGYPLVDHPYDVLELARTGPGANIGARGGDFYTKLFASPLTGTDRSLYNWYRRYIANLPTWRSAEDFRQSHYGEMRVVSSSRLSFVPKNDKISRCICTEPSLNTYFQLGFGAHLERRLAERYGISLATQQFKNRDLARLGSITDGLSTLDLSSASDSISLSMLRDAFPPDFVRWLERYRCTETEVPGAGTVPLYMVSSMGNGYTFPLQTCIFACVVVTCANLRGIPLGPSGSGNSWGVFGDDIICPREITRDVIHLLTLLGFTVNDDKSFVEGPFRESCGSDFYLGTNIRGVYLKELKTVASRYSAINQLLRFETQHGIALRRLINRLIQTVPALFVPPHANSDSGIHVPLSMNPYRRDKWSQSYFYIGLEPVLPRIKILEEEVVVPRRQKRRIYNPEGLMISLLQGSVNSCQIGVRTDTIRYRRKRHCTPWWGYGVRPPRDRQDYEMDWGRWESVVESYLKE